MFKCLIYNLLPIILQILLHLPLTPLTALPDDVTGGVNRRSEPLILQSRSQAIQSAIKLAATYGAKVV